MREIAFFKSKAGLINKPLLELSKLSNRDSRLLRSIMYSLASKFSGIVIALITIPLTSGYFDKELFGVWMLVTGMLATLSFVDLGIGIGLQNGVGKSFGLDDPSIAKKFIANSYVVVFLVVACLITSLFLLSKFTWGDYEISSVTRLSAETCYALMIGAYLYLVGVPASLVHRILNGYQENHTTNILIVCGSVLGFIGVCVAIALDLGFLGVLILFVISPVVVNGIYSLYFFYTRGLFSLNGRIDRQVISKLLGDGGWSLLAQLLYAVKINAPPIIIGIVAGVVAVGEYGVAQKVVSVLGLMVAVALQPLWSAYGEAYHRKDRDWIIKALKRSVSLVLIVTLPSFAFLICFAQDIVKYWLQEVVPSVSLIASLSIWLILSNINVCFAMFLNGIGAFKRQSIISLLFMGVALPTSYYSGLVWSDAGVVFGFILVAEFARMPFLANEVRRELMGMDA